MEDDAERAARQRMVAEQIVGRGITDPRVLRAMAKVPRHRFVEPALAGRAYGDYPLPIGEQQTISQPYMVALMTEALALAGQERVLEVGTGSGYQAAMLAELCAQVYTMERIPVLAERARTILQELGYSNIAFRVGDGSLGWEEEAPFDGIVVTAAAPNIPRALIDQLADGGRLVVPVGDQFSQTLKKVIKTERGVRTEDSVGCVFVKLVGEQAWKS